MNDLQATSQLLRAMGLVRATLLVDEERARNNILRLAARGRASRCRLRPHFKTHQSADVARWFRDAGVSCATVSSLDQAAYFVDHGWDDLVVAIGINPLEHEVRRDLAGRCKLGLTVDHPDQVEVLASEEIDARLWIELDVGDGRAGIAWDARDRLADLAGRIVAQPQLAFRGLLTHAGHTYGRGPGDAAAIFAETRERLVAARDALVAAGLPRPLISAGDTPGFSVVQDWQGLDEARPGNFVFHDLMQLAAGICTTQDLSCAVAAPVIGVYPERGTVIVHAGAVHLGKDRVETPQGPIFGQLGTLDELGFADPVPGAILSGLSQEHGVIRLPGQHGLRPGDLVLIFPAHSCLSCEQFGHYVTLQGRVLRRFRRQ